MKADTEKIPIKIEDDSDEEDATGGKKVDGEVKTLKLEKLTQTEMKDTEEALKELVAERMRKYQEAFVKDEIFNRQFEPALMRIQRENDELKRQMKLLCSKLETYERNQLKRKRSLSPKGLLTGRSVPLSKASSEKSVTQNKTSDRHATTQDIIKTNVNTKIPIHHQPLTQQRYNQPPVQMVTPVPQMNNIQPIRHHYPEPRFILVDGGNQIIGSNVHGVNTQVVSANQGLRMTSISSDATRIQRFPLNAQARIINTMNQYQQLFNAQQVPSNIALQPAHQHAHVQQPIRRQQPTYQQIQPRALHDLSPRVVPNVEKTASTLPRLKASISASGTGIILTWDFETAESPQEKYKVECYHLFAHQAKNSCAKPPSDIKQWKKIGVVNALPLPMACTLTHFATGNVYFFSVLAVDVHGREGEMSNPCIIRLNLD